MVIMDIEAEVLLMKQMLIISKKYPDFNKTGLRAPSGHSRAQPRKDR
jgi:hypothetical protein